ncbi:hypothetical protein DOTSEDRAFT_69847 [Dothistroma septosporum NZE10]|uniref:FAD-binding FR-type domain-containing protein n=1 Tax=Dothistroma septosporum (strain NZE10 / CBS 128990) TaxID=675120 RepID=N1Q0Q9_DOTSN|nr:hypothetical protein DOTSEDRAFT_69847 [Dothistroma septosporum NZE10]
MHSLLSHLHYARGLVGQPVAAHVGGIIARDSLPEAIAASPPYIVQDTGAQLNMTAAATAYDHGLAGVNQGMNFLFIHVLIASFCGLLLATLLYRWWHMLHSHFRHISSMGRDADQRYWMYNHNGVWPWLKKNLLYAPLFRNRHNREFRLTEVVTVGTLPSRFHSVLLVLYLASNIAYTLAIDWNLKFSPAVAEMRGRTGVLAALNLIPTVLFALRNNPLIPILGVSYDTFNLLHRWCARVMILEAIIHSLTWGVNAAASGGLEQVLVSLQTSRSYSWGMVGSCIFTFMFFSSVGPVRHALYETFLNSHRLFALMGIIGVYIHLDAANLPMLPWVQLCLAFWVAEIVWRISRILYHNWSRKRGLTKVTVEYSSAEACRVTFELSRPWKWTPGCHVHAYIPALALWSSHPFSVAWAENRSRAAPMEIEMEKLAPAEAILVNDVSVRPFAHGRNHHRKSVSPQTFINAADKTPQQEATNNAQPRASDVTHLSLIVRARTGMTRRMLNKILQQQTKSYTTWGFIEGPYGGHHSMSSYGTIILFAGGVGITHCVGYVHHLLQQYQAGTCCTRKILLVWSVPNTDSLEWIREWMDIILRMEGRRDVLRIQLFVSKPRHRNEVISSTGSVQMFPGRCSPQTILDKEIPERIGSVGVTVCGPGAFADSVRAACRSVMDEVSLDFIEESFTY